MAVPAGVIANNGLIHYGVPKIGWVSFSYPFLMIDPVNTQPVTQLFHIWLHFIWESKRTINSRHKFNKFNNIFQQQNENAANMKKGRFDAHHIWNALMPNKENFDANNSIKITNTKFRLKISLQGSRHCNAVKGPSVLSLVMAPRTSLKVSLKGDNST